MKRVALVLVVFVAVTLSISDVSVGAPGHRTPQFRGAFVEDEVIVKFKSDVDPQVVARSVGARIHRRIDTLGVYILKIPPGAVDGTVLALTNNFLVEFAEPNGYMYAILDPNDPYDNTSCYQTSRSGCVTQWAWSKVRAYQAWNITTGSNLIKVAVVDTGVDVGDATGLPPDNPHPDLSCSPPRPAVMFTSFVPGENGDDDNGHGTHVTGIIGACTNNGAGVAGANWNVALLSAKVLDFSGAGTFDAVAQGIIWAADNGANVVNLSLGGGPSSTVESAVNYAWSRGVVLACAAGNNGNSTLVYPAAYANCIAVAATNKNDRRANFSSFGASWVDVAAPGVGILSIVQDNFYWCFLCYWYGYKTGYDALSGTSMAAPHVAGLAALIWASGKCAAGDNACVRNRIESRADKITGTGTYWKYGRVNYYKAVSP